MVQIGLTEDRGFGYVGVFTKARTNIKSGERKSRCHPHRRQHSCGEATNMKDNITKGYSGGYVLSDNPQFADDLAEKRALIVFPKKESPSRLTCPGPTRPWKCRGHAQRRTAFQITPRKARSSTVLSDPDHRVEKSHWPDRPTTRSNARRGNCQHAAAWP